LRYRIGGNARGSCRSRGPCAKSHGGLCRNCRDRSLVKLSAIPGECLEGQEHWKAITDAAVEVGPALFFSLLIITLSFIPIFTLQA